MLTHANEQVNSIVMVAVRTSHPSVQSAQHKLVQQLLSPLVAKRRPERILVIKQANAGDLPLQLTYAAQIIRLSTAARSDQAPLQCRLTELPFEQATFDLVILHHLISDGSEAFMNEVLRVTVAGGDLVVSGLNSSGLRNRFGNRDQRVPPLKLNKVCSFLKSHSFEIEHCLLMGVAGLSRPSPRSTWHGIGWPCADRVVLHAHHKSNINNASVLRFKKPQSTRRASTAFDGCSSREAAS